MKRTKVRADDTRRCQGNVAQHPFERLLQIRTLSPFCNSFHGNTRRPSEEVSEEVRVEPAQATSKYFRFVWSEPRLRQDCPDGIHNLLHTLVRVSDGHLAPFELAQIEDRARTQSENSVAFFPSQPKSTPKRANTSSAAAPTSSISPSRAKTG